MITEATVNESSYEGPAEIWVDGVKRFDAAVRLTGYMEVEEIVTLGEVQYFEGPHSWDGYISSGLTEEDLLTLQAVGTFELRLPYARKAGAVLPAAGAYLRGLGEAPF